MAAEPTQVIAVAAGFRLSIIKVPDIDDFGAQPRIRQREANPNRVAGTLSSKLKAEKKQGALRKNLEHGAAFLKWMNGTKIRFLPELNAANHDLRRLKI